LQSGSTLTLDLAPAPDSFALSHDSQFNFNDWMPLPEFLFGDQTRLQQVLVNLLNNAVKYASG